MDVAANLKAGRKKMLFIIGGLVVFNTLMFAVFAKGRGFTANLMTGLNANLLGLTVIGFILGAIIALFPYKRLGYGKKYLRSSLLTILVLQVIEAIGVVFMALLGI